MTNPWLGIAGDDYVGHMSSAEVGQHQALNRIFRDILISARPRSVLILGCSTGNGLEHVDPSATSRVVAIDINPSYLEQLAERFPAPAFQLDVRCANLVDCEYEAGSFDLIHAALVFEYVEWSRALPALAAALRLEGILSVVLQRPSSEVPTVTPTRFTSLRSLESIFHFVDPGRLVGEASSHGLRVESRQTVPLPSGKTFEVICLRRRNAP
jgi:SAM-dependent methyltransferase